MIRTVLCTLLSAHGWTALASHETEVKSVRRFVQSFYDWYTPIASSDNIHEITWMIAVKRKRDLFDPKLAKALEEDHAAQEKNHDDLVSIDFDPFMSSQDPDPRYVIGQVQKKGAFYYVSMRRVPQKARRPAEVAVIAKVEKHKRRWRFVNFLEPHSPSDLLSTLKLLKKDREKPLRKGSHA